MVHEAVHIKQAMLKAYNVDDIGEPPAYTIGYLVMKMYEVFKPLFVTAKYRHLETFTKTLNLRYLSPLISIFAEK